jgi:GNAT superfamily N-acetyltransferase
VSSVSGQVEIREFREVTAADAPALSELFRRSECGCHCRYWHFQGDKNAWLDRLRFSPEDSARELAADLADPALGTQGVIAVDGARVTGWMKVSPASRLSKLYAQRPYRGMPDLGADRPSVYAIGCALVDPAERRKGLTRGLLDAALEAARRAGARSVEAFPRDATMLGDEELWMGPYQIFVERGFQIAHAIGQYPVFRKEL